uniref:VWFD domain-containing protein n=1 Tax=Amphimedon queenslandica TaxID=400682 RepID=A0A1X7VX27_AMPQE
MSSLMSFALLFLCIFVSFKCSASNVVKRETDRMAMATCTNASACSVTCGGGCMIQYCRCEDQAGAALQLCGSQPCCNIGDFRNGSNPLSCIQCNMQACPGGPASVNEFIPHTGTFTLVDSVTGMIAVTTTRDAAMISITIQVPDPTGYSTTFNTTRTTTQMGTQTSFSASQGFSAPTYEISNGMIKINGQSLIATGSFLAVRTIPSTGSFSYTGSAGFYKLGTGSGVATFSGYMPYYYISPFGHLYEYSGPKAVQVKATGKVFVRLNQVRNERLIITSENSYITGELSKQSGAAMTIEPVGAGAAIGFNFRGTGTNAFTITSSTNVRTAVSPTSYTGSTLMVGSMTFNNIDNVLLAGEGFEQYRSASNEATAFVSYDSFFINAHNAVFSTSSKVTAMIQEGQMFLAGGGTSQAAYTVEGNRVKYGGVTVFTINSGFTESDIAGPVLLSYNGQALSGSANNTGIESFAYNVGNTNGIAFNGDATVSSGPDINVRLYVSGSEAFATSSQSLNDNITAATMPRTITGLRAMYTTVLESGNTGILQLNGQNVVEFTGSAMSVTLNDGDAVSYSGGTISFTPCNSRGPFTGISMFTYAPNGQNIVQYNPIASKTFNVDSSYQIVVDSNGNTLLTNDGMVKGLLSNPQFGVTFSNRDAQGNFFLMIRCSSIERMGRNTARHEVPTGGTVRLLGTSFGGIMNGNAIFLGVTASLVQTYYSNETIPTTVSGTPPYNQTAMTIFYVYITGDPGATATVFITDRATLDAAINSELLRPVATSTPDPAIPGPGTTAPPPVTTSGITVVIRNDEMGNPIVRAMNRNTGSDTNIISLTGGSQLNISTGQTIEYKHPNLSIVKPGGIRQRLSGNIFECIYFRDGDLQSFFQNATTTASRDGLLVASEISGTAFFTDDSETIDTIRSANPPTTFSGGVIIIDGNPVLTIGGSVTNPITENTTLSVSSVQSVRFSNSRYSVINQDGSTAFRSKNQMFNTLIQYQSNSDQVNVLSLTSTEVAFQGPQTISVSSDRIIVSNRPEINNAIDAVISPPSQTVGTRVDSNNNTILVIGGRDILPMNNALVRRVQSYEFISYNNSLINVTNAITDKMSGSMIPANVFTTYTPNDDEPISFNESASSMPFGFGYLYYTPINDSFFVSRPDVASTIFSIFNVTSTLPPPPATMTPIPEEPISPGNPDTAFVLNSDGSSWVPYAYTPCSRTCGGGIRVRQLKCQTPAGDHVRTCTQPTEPTSTDIPPSIKVCSLQDCNNPNTILNVPAPDVSEVNMTITGVPGSAIYGRGIYYITSSASDDTYMITFNSHCMKTGSTYKIVQERVNGALVTNNNINLETNFVDRILNSTITDFTVNYNYNGMMFPVTVIRSDGFHDDEVVTTSGSVSYNNGVLIFDMRNLYGFTMVTKLDRLQRIEQEVVTAPPTEATPAPPGS